MMSNPSLFALSAIRAVVEVALMALLGQGLLALLAGSRRDGNAIYQLFKILTRPVLRLLRVVTLRAIPDRRLPLLAFVVLFSAWIFLAYAKHSLCRAEGLVC